jgi:nucleoid-associated protein YgaU
MKLLKLVGLLFLLLFVVPATAITAQTDVVCDQEVVVQADDWLSKIAEKSYGDVFAYQAIADATNAKHEVMTHLLSLKM